MQRASAHMVLACACIALIFAVVLIAPAPPWSAQPQLPPAAGQEPLADQGWPSAALALAFLIGLCLPFRPYVLALRAADRVGKRLFIICTALLTFTALLIYPRFGSDLFVYAAHERLWTVYGTNPLTTLPVAHSEDWAFRYIWQPLEPSPYGPLWAVLTWPIVKLAGDSIAALVLGYKLLSLAAYVACCVLLWRWLPADRRFSGVAWFAWSPLVLFEALGKVHNDVLLALAALLAVRLATGGGLIAATAGALVKLSGIALVPPLLASHIRERRWVAFALTAGASATLVVVFYGLLWDGPATLTAVNGTFGSFVWSPASLLLAAGFSPLLSRALLAALWVLVAVFISLRERNLTSVTSWVWIASVLLLTTHVYAHYVVPAVAVSGLSTSQALKRAVLALSIGTLAAYAIDPLQLAMPAGWSATPSYQALGTTILVAPLVLVLLSGRRSGRRSLPRSTPGDAAPA